ncbi:MAG: ABC transporter permease [Bryobacteraceae bacterium]
MNTPVKIALALWVPLLIVTSWQAGVQARAIDPLFFPAPTMLVDTAAKMIRSGEMAMHLQATFGRLLIGFSIGSLAGIGCGVLMGVAPLLRRSFEPMVTALYSTPKLSLLPMVMLVFGVTDTARILIIAATCFVLTSIHAIDAVRAVDRRYVDLASNYGASRAMLFRKVYLPSSLPQLFTGLRLALGRSLVTAISVEIVSSKNGLGSIIWLAWQTFSIERLYVGVILAASVGALLHLGLKQLENRWIPWKAE